MRDFDKLFIMIYDIDKEKDKGKTWIRHIRGYVESLYRQSYYLIQAYPDQFYAKLRDAEKRDQVDTIKILKIVEKDFNTWYHKL